VQFARIRRRNLIGAAFISTLLGLGLIATGCTTDQVKSGAGNAAKALDKADVIATIELNETAKITSVSIEDVKTGESRSVKRSKRGTYTATINQQQKLRLVVHSSSPSLTYAGSGAKQRGALKLNGDTGLEPSFSFNEDSSGGSTALKTYNPFRLEKNEQDRNLQLQIKLPPPPTDSLKEKWDNAWGPNRPEFNNLGFTVHVTR
jgi:hypothetical protein